MRHYCIADNVTFDSDEAGWKLRVLSEDGDLFVFNIHHLAFELAQHADQTIGAWRREGEHARATHVPRPTQHDLEGYELGDPKRIALEREMNK